MVLLDRLAVQGYVSQCDPLAAAAAVAAAATREGIAIDAGTLAGTLDYNVSPLCCAAWAYRCSLRLSDVECLAPGQRAWGWGAARAPVAPPGAATSTMYEHALPTLCLAL